MERALYRVKYGSATDLVHVPATTEWNHPTAPPYVKLPKVMNIEMHYDKEHMPNHIGVAARMWTDQPFG